MAGTLEFVKLSTCVLDLANSRVEGVGLQRVMAGTLGFAKPSTWVLDLANVSGWACEGRWQGHSDLHLCAQFGKCEGGWGGLAKNDGRFGKCKGGESAGG